MHMYIDIDNISKQHVDEKRLKQIFNNFQYSSPKIDFLNLSII